MSKIEVLVACMNKNDDSLYREMNLSTDAILASQGNSFEYKEYAEENGSKVKLISSANRGVGKNRNKALLYATGEYLLFSDDDIVYTDNYAEIVENAFNVNKDADIIAFDLNYVSKLVRVKPSEKKAKRLYVWNSMRYGAPSIAVRRAAIEKHCVFFSHLYGGGAEFSSGEDNIFIRECLRKGMKMYYCPDCIASVKQDSSSWFKGYNDKFFIDEGVLLANLFPVMKSLLMYYFAFGMRKLSKDYGYFKICKLIRQGFKVFKQI